MQWVLEPYGERHKSCKMFVLNQVEDTIWLDAIAYNRCAPDGVAQRYWFVCSFYGFGEQEVEVKIYPNPTDGVFVIEADEIEQVRVVDMLGQVVDDRKYNHANSVTLDLGGRPASIYLAEIRTKEGWIKRKIVLNR